MQGDTVSHLGGVRQTARHRRCFNELWKFTKFCAQNSWKLNERTRAFRENWIQSFFFALIFYCNYEVIFMYLYLWYMLSIITFYIENCTFLYYFIQYLKKIKATIIKGRFQDSWYKGTWYRDAWYKDAWYKDKRSKQTLGPKDTWYIGQKVQRQMVQSNTWYNRQKFQCFVKPDKRSNSWKV